MSAGQGGQHRGELGQQLPGHEPQPAQPGRQPVPGRRMGVLTPDGGLSRLGTSGSGDVLAGAVGGLLARGAEPAQAAVWGQYAHAAAGDRLAARAGRVGFLARELLDELPQVLAALHT